MTGKNPHFLFSKKAIILALAGFAAAYLSLPMLTQICIDMFGAESCVWLGRLRFQVVTDDIWDSGLWIIGIKP